MHPYKRAFIYADFYSPDDLDKLSEVAFELKSRQEILNFYNKAFSKIDAFALIRDLCYDAFDNAKDYKKYGSMFFRIIK